MSESVAVEFECKENFQVDIKTEDGMKTACHGVIDNMLDALSLKDSVIATDVRDEAYDNGREENVVVSN